MAEEILNNSNEPTRKRTRKPAQPDPEKPFYLWQLIKFTQDTNSFQWLHRCARRLKVCYKGKKELDYGEITFIADKELVRDLMVGGSEWLPIVVWVRRDSLPMFMKEKEKENN